MKVDVIVSRHPGAIEWLAKTLGGTLHGVQGEELVPSGTGHIIRTSDQDHEYTVGEKIVIADCDGWLVGEDARYKYACRCGYECRSGTTSVLVGVEVLPSRHIRLADGRTIPVIASATPDDVRGKVVIGTLPLHLAALCNRIIAIEFAGSPPRGQEYSVAEMETAGARLAEYVVSAE